MRDKINISLDTSYIKEVINSEGFEKYLKESKSVLEPIIYSYKDDKEKVLGWMDIDKLQEEELIKKIEEKAKEIRENADVFIVVGVGGSNGGSRAAIEALYQGDNPKIIYMGNNLSPNYINHMLKKIKGKSIYINVIAKNFETLEPGLGFRMLRNYMESVYSKEEMSKRIITTGTIGERLYNLSIQEGYTFLPFPVEVGGRYSVLSAVGLMPISVSGISIREMLSGAKALKEYFETIPYYENEAFIYAALRNYLSKRGVDIEILSYFEPGLRYFGKWWVQLFGESEGKDNKGLFPSSCNYSEDLHAMGQYIQDGKRNLMETFINVLENNVDIDVPKSNIEDKFDYLNSFTVGGINRCAYEGTIEAHKDGGVSIVNINISKLNAYSLGQLFYWFEISCYASSKLIGVNPFDQMGVENYKKIMFERLGK